MRSGASRSSPQQITWHGVKLNEPDWGFYSHSIALEIDGNPGDQDFYLAFNAYWGDLEFELPTRGETQNWRLVIDTSQPSPHDIADPGQELPIASSTYKVRARSVVILMAPHVPEQPPGSHPDA